MRAKAHGLVVSVGVCAIVLAAATQSDAQQSASALPSPSPTSTSAASSPVWHNPPNTRYAIVDPCGGFKELLNKFGPTPCVYVAGEAMVSAGYANINTHGALQVTGTGQRGVNAGVPFSANASVYPLFFLVAGVSANSQIQITPPSQIDVHTQNAGTLPASSGAALNYKQRVFFSPKSYTQLAVDLGYTAPSGGATSAAPAYQIQLDVAQPLNQNVAFGLWWTFRNAAASPTQSTERGWSDPLGLYFGWSPAAGTFELLPVVYHDSNPNRTALLIQAVQLLSRRVSIAVTYGGMQTSMQSNGPFGQTVNLATTGSPRVVELNLFYLINESDLPPQAPVPAATPST